jgi:hypothetical protein
MSFRVEACPGRAAIAAAGENFTDMTSGKVNFIESLTRTI